jgi:hypothetical protein
MVEAKGRGPFLVCSCQTDAFEITSPFRTTQSSASSPHSSSRYLIPGSLIIEDGRAVRDLYEADVLYNTATVSFI